MTNSTSTSTSNAHAHALPTRKRAVKPLPQAVPDDWDADDDESEDNSGNEGAGHGWTDTEQSCVKAGVPADERRDNARVWQEANAKAPMPDLIISPSSTCPGAFAPPSAAFKPALRILKRPSPSSSQPQSPSHSQARSPPGSGTVTPSGSQSRGSLAEREAQYLEARNRIFGPSSLMDQAEVERSSGLNARSDASAQCNHSREPTSVTVIRDPLGPPVESSSDQKAQLKGGFCERRRGRNTGQGDGVLCSSARPSRP